METERREDEDENENENEGEGRGKWAERAILNREPTSTTVAVGSGKRRYTLHTLHGTYYTRALARAVASVAAGDRITSRDRSAPAVKLQRCLDTWDGQASG